MNPFALLLGVVVIGVGVYSFLRPMTGPWVSGRDWERSPEDAERKQRRIARAAGVGFVLLGLVFVLVGIT